MRLPFLLPARYVTLRLRGIIKNRSKKILTTTPQRKTDATEEKKNDVSYITTA